MLLQNTHIYSPSNEPAQARKKRWEKAHKPKEEKDDPGNLITNKYGTDDRVPRIEIRLLIFA